MVVVLPLRKLKLHKARCRCLLLLALLLSVAGFSLLNLRPKLPHNLASAPLQEEYIDRHGIKVVVGHYVGPSLLHSIPNATYEQIHGNAFRPEPAAGRNGEPVITPSRDFALMQQLFQINRFNLLASDRIPLNRSLPDVRRPSCKLKNLSSNITIKATIIIVFHNEAWSTLLRTVWSVINKSPPDLLEEIILVDDTSNREYLLDPLNAYLAASIPAQVTIQVIRMQQRAGLVRARLAGVKVAKGDALVFLDAHCECTQGWLEPLLARVKERPHTAVCPVIDIINAETFAYVKSFDGHFGALNWNLQFRWFTLGVKEMLARRSDPGAPFATPTMAGGLFAINKQWFEQVGAYDEQMEIWGGENLEMSFRLWQCGGGVEIAPCSHVGHVFRGTSPYGFPRGVGETLYGNLARAASVWMDEWADFYFRFNADGRRAAERVDVTERKKLRTNLGCRSFKWYLDTVWPSNFFPGDDRFFGRVRSLATDNCLTRPQPTVAKSVGGVGRSNQPAAGLAGLADCTISDQRASSMQQLFVHEPNGRLMTDDSICLDAPDSPISPTQAADPKMVLQHKVRLVPCSGHALRQHWRHNNATKELIHESNQLCLDIQQPQKNQKDNNIAVLILAECNGSANQRWQLSSVLWH